MDKRSFGENFPKPAIKFNTFLPAWSGLLKKGSSSGDDRGTEEMR